MDHQEGGETRTRTAGAAFLGALAALAGVAAFTGFSFSFTGATAFTGASAFRSFLALNFARQELFSSKFSSSVHESSSSVYPCHRTRYSVFPCTRGHPKRPVSRGVCYVAVSRLTRGCVCRRLASVSGAASRQRPIRIKRVLYGPLTLSLLLASTFSTMNTSSSSWRYCADADALRFFSMRMRRGSNSSLTHTAVSRYTHSCAPHPWQLRRLRQRVDPLRLSGSGGQ
jgi:hypothetical protein